MNRASVKLAYAIAIAGMICGLAASPALADRDHDHWRDKHHEHHRWRRPPVRYYRGYEQRYYAPQPEVYYAPPPVYVPPPPSWGLNLVFPLRIH
jgi:hypothetical protein